MNKIAMLFVFCAGMFVALCSASSSEAVEEAPIYIGWSCKDMTPDKPVSLYGQYYQRISQYVQSPLKVTALALESKIENGKNEQAIMVSCDVAGIGREFQDMLR
jgi:hypothetical protein